MIIKIHSFLLKVSVRHEWYNFKKLSETTQTRHLFLISSAINKKNHLWKYSFAKEVKTQIGQLFIIAI